MLPGFRAIMAAVLITLIFSGNFVFLQSVESAESYIYNLKIDGTSVSVDPPALIAGDRTMVPLRFIIENSAIRGEVFWDGDKQKVALDCQGHYFEFHIGQKTARIDGVSMSLDTAPFIWQNRSYVPLRFLAENLGAVVSWNGLKREICINLLNKPGVFAYYYYSPMEEVKANIGLFTDIAFRWLVTDGEGNLSYDYQDQYRQKIEWVRGQGVKAHASVALMNRDKLHQLLSNPQHRKQLTRHLADIAASDSYDGINIDFEFIAPEDGSYFTEFLQELKTALGEEKMLSVAVFARTGKEQWPTAYDYRAIGATADLVVVMAYDYSYLESDPGPVAPIWWVKDVIAYMESQMPREKILLGMPTYGYDWSSDGLSKTINISKLKQLQSSYQLEDHFDQKSFSPYYTYYDEQGCYHELWMENAISLTSKWTICLEEKLGGIAFWRIGTGFMDLYDVLRQSNS